MADGISISGEDAAKRALSDLPRKIQLAADKGVAYIAHAYEEELKSNRVLLSVQNNRKDGRHEGKPGGFPNRRTGNLARSIEVQRKGLGAYKVGSGAIYSRSLELGNPRWGSRVRYPFMGPVAQVLRPHAQRLFTHTFRQNFR
jgi:hypothetical protein